MSTALSTQRPRQLFPLFRPFGLLQQEFDELFNRLSADWDGGRVISESNVASDLSETADAYQIRMDVPGIKADDINVQVTGNTVQISGERKEEKEEKGKTYHRVERRSGRFAQTLRLPSAVNEEKVQAEFQDGVLTITLPKSEASKTRTVKVKG